MSLSLSAILPHHPLLLPSIAKDNLSSLQTTISALNGIAASIKAKQIDSLIIISEHNHPLKDKVTIGHCPEFKVDLSDFGDLSTDFSCLGDLELSYQIRERLEDNNIVNLACPASLDYGMAVPLFYIHQHHPVKIIPIFSAHPSLELTYKLGQSINEIINISSKRIAVIAAGDLSHTLSSQSPAGYSEIGKKFDNLLIKYLRNKDISQIINFDSEVATEAKQCILRPLSLLLGILDKSNFSTDITSYEHPFGIGHLVAKFR